MSYKKLFMVAAAGILFFNTACTPVQANRGNFLRDEKIGQVELNMTTKAEMTRIFGPPTTVAAFDDNTWFYIGERTETMGMFETEVVERRIVQVQFDENGVLSALEELDVAQAQDIEIVGRTTNTAGKDFTMLQQLVGNIGRFSPRRDAIQTGE